MPGHTRFRKLATAYRKGTRWEVATLVEQYIAREEGGPWELVWRDWWLADWRGVGFFGRGLAPGTLPNNHRNLSP